MLRNPDQLFAVCTRVQAELLVPYDHHRVKVGSRWGIMITYPWLPLDEAQEPLVLTVVFNPSPEHLPSPDQARVVVFQHPLAPEPVQTVIDSLQFRIRSD